MLLNKYSTYLTTIYIDLLFDHWRISTALAHKISGTFYFPLPWNQDADGVTLLLKFEFGLFRNLNLRIDLFEFIDKGICIQR